MDGSGGRPGSGFAAPGRAHLRGGPGPHPVAAPASGGITPAGTGVGAGGGPREAVEVQAAVYMITRAERLIQTSRPTTTAKTP